MIIIGIDPGKTGGIAVLAEDWYDVYPIPLAGDEIDMTSIYSSLRLAIEPSRSDQHIAAFIEKVGAMPGQGVSSMFSFGFTTGALHGIIASLGIPRYMVTPQAWKKVVLEGTSKDKNAAIEYCRRAYPFISLLATDRSKVCHTGMADAICIAEYGRRRLNKEQV
jgi:crossover junction endodeoxyribonuclease RuvC